MSNTTLSTSPYKGTTDFLPADFNKRNYIFRKWRECLDKFGYEEYETSLLESAEVYRLKSGEELGTKQIYSFQDKGDRLIALRPEQTPSLARLVADNFGQLRMPLRWYSIPNCFRYEQPQRGRRREFWQLNVDMIGVEEGWADVEIIKMAAETMLAFGAKKEDFTIFYNHRGVLDSFLEEVGVQPDQKPGVYKVLDDWSRVTIEESEAALSQVLTEDKAKNHILCLLEGMDKEVDLWDDIADDEFPEFVKIQENLTTLLGDSVDIQLNPAIVRGLAYYTGTVFEVFDTNPENSRSLFGGGRYDNLLDLYGKKAGCVGFGAGQVTMTDFLETHDLMPAEFSNAPKLTLIPVTETDIQKCWETEVAKYQLEGYQVTIDYDIERSANKRRESAVKKGSKPIVIE
ncbi:MAG: histidine--tRNA ligase [Patescibacteria group bacterium]